jgi:HNH endonuclease
MGNLDQLLECANTFVKLAELPYAKVYGPYPRSNDPKDKRKIVIVVDKDGKKRTISYPKYLMEKHLDRQLPPEATIDHIDGDVNNNAEDNLQVLDRAEHSSLDTRRVKNLKLKCDECGKDFERSPRLVRDKARKGARGIFCSKSCSAKYSRKVQLGKAKKLPVQPYVASEYYKRKHLAELADYLLEKYGVGLDS